MQMELLRGLLEGVQRQGEAAMTRAEREKDVKLTKLTEDDDIEAYLTTFERLMRAYEVPEVRWAFKLAPQLVGKAQRAYAALAVADAGDYKRVKAAILKRYDITDDSYRRRFRAAALKPKETYKELHVRMEDLVTKWLKTYETVEKIKDQIILEQLLNTFAEDTRVFVKERKPRTSEEACKLADDFMTAREELKKERGRESDKKPQGDRQSIRCNKCKKLGHIARDCRQMPNGKPEVKKEREDAEKSLKPKRDLKDIECYNCHQKGHYSSNCPKNALFCHDPLNRRKILQTCLEKAGSVEGKQADNILLDTGCGRSMVRQDLVPEEKILEGEAVAIRCAHGDTVLYPLAQVKVTVDDQTIGIKAAVAGSLPMDVLLGTDVPELGELLGLNLQPSNVLATTTRSQAKKQMEQELDLQQKDELSGAKLTSLGATCDAEEEPFQNLDDELFGTSREKVYQTRSKKRHDRHKHWEPVQEPEAEQLEEELMPQAMDIATGEMKILQESDTSLDAVREAAKNQPCGSGVGFFERDGLLYRQWIPAGRDKECMAVDQLVVPTQCRKTILNLAHSIPLSGHLGKEKTTRWILQRFYWPTLYRDVAEYCRSCGACQKTSHCRPPKAPLVPLPIIDEPFSRIAMDIVGPLPRSRSGNKYVLVLCDYATRYPEAIPLKSIDASHVAEELVKLFARVGIPEEILTDQGTNFTSQLLTEIYHLLHIHPIRTTPYHPQTDGLVERFNQTLKGMLRKAAVKESKDWDKLIPYLLFAYREVPQSSTGFSPFELLYGRTVRGPLDILRESWVADKKSDESVVSHVLAIREKMEKMTEIVKEKLTSSQRVQKQWYDRNSRDRTFDPGDQVLILLPTSSNKLLAQWQGPYEIIKKMGKVDYMVKLHDRRKKFKVYHVNMLRKWHVPIATACYSEELSEDHEDIPTWEEINPVGVGNVKLGEKLTDKQAEQIQKLLGEYSRVFQAKPGCTHLAEHHIRTKDAVPIKLPPYRLPHAYRETVKTELDEMLKDGIIEPSRSEWSFPLVIVKKSDGSLRLCVDYRRLNQISEFDAYPMPRVEDIIDRIGRSQFISTMDLTRGYWQVPVAVEDKPKTAFVTPFGLFQYNVMPFGLKGAPATFQRLMDRVLHGLEFAGVYIDDLIIFSETLEEHLTHLKTILDKLKEAGLTAKATKCTFGASHCTYLGHIVGSGFVKPIESKTAAIESFKVPQTKKDLLTFLGMAGYYRRFIHDYSAIAAPLTDLTKKSQPSKISWTPECDTAFKELKKLLSSSPILRSPDFNTPFMLQTDASDLGIGAVLSQKTENGEEHPVAYWSRKLLPRERRYSTIEKECLAIKLAVQAFQV